MTAVISKGAIPAQSAAEPTRHKKKYELLTVHADRIHRGDHLAILHWPATPRGPAHDEDLLGHPDVLDRCTHDGMTDLALVDHGAITLPAGLCCDVYRRVVTA